MNILNKVTRKALAKNKMRTLVTIIGIILSAAMFTGVITCVTSMQKYLLDTITDDDGSYYAQLQGVSVDKLNQMRADDDIKTVKTCETVGYAEVNSINEDKPYLYIAGMGEGFTDIVSVHLLEGRMPENDGEIILPAHLYNNGMVKDYNVGSTMTVLVGTRMGTTDNEVLYQNNSFRNPGEDGEIYEELVDKKERTYKVVGIYRRPGFENYSAPGYTALTVSDEKADGTYTVFVQTKKIKSIYETVHRYDPDEAHTRYNSEYMKYTGNSLNDGFNSTLYFMAGILFLIIIAGSISLIYNAFSISVSERTKQMGILKSIGATRKQLRNSVMYEGVVLSAIGIPLGILAGVLGMGITFRALRGSMNLLSSNDSSVVLSLCVKWPALIIAAVVCFVTVLMSVRIPARRVAKRPAIDAIRQSDDIAIKGKKVKTSKLTYKLFKFEGMLAGKNFKRNKKKYRATVMSLFISIVLFVSASGFCGYFTRAFDVAGGYYEYDLSYYLLQSDYKEMTDTEEFKRTLLAADSVTDVIYYNEFGCSYTVTDETTDTKIIDLIRKESSGYSGDVYAVALFMDDESYEKYIDSLGLERSEYMNPDKPLGVAFDKSVIYTDSKYIELDLLKAESGELAARAYRMDIDGTEDEEPDDKPEMVDVVLPFGAVADKEPMGIFNDGGRITVVYPRSAMKALLGVEQNGRTAYYLKSSNPNKSYSELSTKLASMGFRTDRLENTYEIISANRALLTIIKVFSYGFVGLISLISVANVFNTISTNIALRRREFATLRSVGMTKGGFNRMMNYECLIYGLKGIAFGLPVAIAINILMSRGMDYSVVTGVIIPWKSIAIVVCTVFLVVFATMLYAMSKIRKENTVEALKNENY